MPWCFGKKYPDPECLGFRMLRFDLPWFYLIFQFWLRMPWFRNAPYWNALMFWGENYPDPECRDSCTLHFQMPWFLGEKIYPDSKHLGFLTLRFDTPWFSLTFQRETYSRSIPAWFPNSVPELPLPPLATRKKKKRLLSAVFAGTAGWGWIFLKKV